jgi:hypothetical protein
MRRETMADKTGRPEPDRSQGVTSIDATEFTNLIREQAGDQNPPSPVVEEERSEERTEPEVEAETDDKEPKGEEDPLKKALSTVEAQQRRIAELEAGQRRVEGEIRSSTRREPVLEFEEVLPNVRLPKDRSQWPIRLTAEDISRLGIDPGEKGEIAAGLNVLANALYKFVADTIPDYAYTRFSRHLEERESGAEAQRSFESAYPDLKEHTDLVETVEGKIWPQFGNALNQADYTAKLAEESRRRLASIRGVSYEEYMTQVRTNARSTTRVTSSGSRSRAVSTAGSSGGGARRPVPQGQDKEMQDLM